MVQKIKYNKTQYIKELTIIKDYTGLDLKLCEYFTGEKTHKGVKYFNVILNEKISESTEFNLLKRFSEKYKIIKIEPNGLNRVAIFYNDVYKNLIQYKGHNFLIQSYSKGNFVNICECNGDSFRICFTSKLITTSSKENTKWKEIANKINVNEIELIINNHFTNN